MTIPLTFGKPGYDYRLIERLGNVAIYSQTHRATGRLMAHEVLRIRQTTSERTFPNGTTVPAGSEYLPSSEEWGRHGWTVRTLNDAHALIDRKGLVSTASALALLTAA